MARGSIYRDGGEDGTTKLADHTSMSRTQANGSISNPRRSSRLKEITAIYDAESPNPVILSSKHQQETGTESCALSPNRVKDERTLYESIHGPPKQKRNVVDIIDSDDESNTSITLMDLLTRCKLKKRKASEVKGQSHIDTKEHNNVLMMPNEEELELEEAIISFKVKKGKSSPTSEKSNKYAKPTLHSLSVEKKTMLTFPLASGGPGSGLDEANIKETIFDELSVDSDFGPRHNKENVNVKMEANTEQSPLSVGSPKSAIVIKKEIIATCLDRSDDENSIMNSTTVLVNKCDSDNEYLGEVLNKVNEREDLGQPDNVISNIVDPFLTDIIKQCKHDFSSSSAHRSDNFQIPSHDVINVKNKDLVVGSTKCENTAPNVGLLPIFNQQRSLPTDVPQKDEKQKLQIEELVPFDKRDVHLIAAENSTEFIESDCEKLLSSVENNRLLVGSKKSSFSDTPFNKIIASLVPEFKASDSCDNFGGPIDGSAVSSSLENHDNFISGMKHDSIKINNCLGAIHNHRSLDIGSDWECSMVNENCGELVSQSMQPLSTCILSQMDHSILSSNTLVSVDAPCSITEIGSTYVNPVCEDGKQASHYDGDSLNGLTTTDYLLDADGWAPQTDKLLPSSQVHMLNRCSERRPCSAKVSDLTDAVKSGQIVCHCPVSKLHEIEVSTVDQINDGLSKSASAMNTITFFPNSSSLEPSTQICVEKQINMQTTEIQVADTKFGGNLCMEVEHSPKKLLSNRKEISPNSQEKLLRALNNGGLDDVVKLSNCMKKLCFDKGATQKPLSSVLDNGETFLETERMIKKPKTMNQSLLEVTKGILKSPDTICCNPCCLKNSSIHAQTHDAILFSQRQMQDTENIATKLLKGLNSLKSIVEETIFSEGLTSFPSKMNVDEIKLATKHASKLEVTTKKWLAMMAKDCTRFCKIMRLAENKLASPVNDLHKGRKKITFADEAGGTLCQVKVYEQQPVAFIFPKS